jgi:hypothetical protein
VCVCVSECVGVRVLTIYLGKGWESHTIQVGIITKVDKELWTWLKEKGRCC